MILAKMTKRNRKKFLLAEEARLEKKWSGQLDRAGWKETAKGWRQGNKVSLPIAEAIVELHKQQRAERMAALAAIPDYLKENGWEQCGPNGDVWKRPNWDTDYGDGYCFATIMQAYKIQRGLDLLE